MEETNIPEFLIKMLNNQYGEKLCNDILNGYSQIRVSTFRVNTSKTDVKNIENILKKENIKYEKTKWSENAIILKEQLKEKIENMSIYKNGEIYFQSLSSMLPAIILTPKEKEDILDMAAAPGGKTTQLANITNNNANITACEMNSIRIEKLKYNIEKQGAKSVYIMKVDSRKLNDFFSFDKILLDAPCSGSGTININDKKTLKTFNENLIKKCVSAQYSLLSKAVKILKSGEQMVYSTCSILQEENEDIIKKILKTNKVEIIPITFEGIEEIELLPTKIPGTLCIKPTKYYEGFFIAKLKKK